MKLLFNLVLLFLLTVFVCSCNSDSDGVTHEVIPREIKLTGIGSERFVEASGLTWFNDWLVILPQYPHKISTKGNGALLAVHKNVLLNYVSGTDTGSVSCRLVPFTATGLDSLLQSNGSGLEAVAFYNNEVFFIAEDRDSNSTNSVLLKGKVFGDLDSIVVDPNYMTEIESASDIENFGDEAMVINKNVIYTIHEVNGNGIVTSPHSSNFNTELQKIGQIPFPGIEYRITDATCLDEHGTFYVLNYFYSGDTHIKPKTDPIADRWGIGKTNQMYSGIERILECKLTQTGMTLTESPPIYIYLPNNTGRNWEGIAKFDDLGFLIVTDYYPKTVFAFIPFPN